MTWAQSEDCVSAGCHDQLLNKSVIHPAAEEDCFSCHESTGNPHPDSLTTGFKLVAQIPDLCYECHDRKDNLPVVHEPVKDGSCLDCHTVHASNSTGLLVVEEGESICASCHEIESSKNIHPPYEDEDCMSCHAPHHSLREALLIEDIPTLCFNCHDDLHDLLKNAQYVHAPFEEECLSCHAPHISKNKNLLLQKPNSLCFECHEEAEVDSTKLKPYTVHGGLKKSAPCLNCHTPHASNMEAVLKKETPELCLTCHNRGSPEIGNIKDKLRNAKVIHAPIEDEGCLVCHNVHEEKFPFLLVDYYPATFYAENKPENFALCFECHDSDLFNPKYKETGFRNGQTNLHAVHINRPKGRICTLCHDVHAAKSEHLIPKTVHFGKWNMPLNYQVNQNGGSCTPGCHGQKSYKR